MSTSNTNTDPWFAITSTNTGLANVGSPGVVWNVPYQMTSTSAWPSTTTQVVTPPQLIRVTDIALNEDGLILDVGPFQKAVIPKELLKRLATLCTMAQLAGLVEADDAAK